MNKSPGSKKNIKRFNKNREKQNIIGICDEYSDIFYLEGDQLTTTDVVTHKINTPRLTKAINIHSYRILWELVFAIRTETAYFIVVF